MGEGAAEAVADAVDAGTSYGQLQERVWCWPNCRELTLKPCCAVALHMSPVQVHTSSVPRLGCLLTAASTSTECREGGEA